ncbi:MAG: DUF4838 domain-containing protein [Verrucomicrobiaceae bacterium]|nr:DUF4838 domain-containing protein [Verrucomicrobiaceae bacterium]
MKLTLSSIALLLVPLAAHSADFIIVAKDVAPAPIIVDAGAPPRTHDAAVTLADYVEKISGQRPEVMKGAPQAMPEHAIWVSVSPTVKTLFPKADLDFQHPEETLILANENHLVIAGRDRWDPDHMEAKGRLAMKTDMQQEYGTANAVYSFIQDQLGVRWLWPAEEDLVQRDRIAVAPCEIRYHPSIRARSGLLQKLSLGDNKEGVDELWARFQRVQLDSMEIDGGHGFGDWWEKYGKSHPEYFAAAPDGSRPSLAPNAGNTKLCASNPAVWKQWLANVEEELAADPTKNIFNVSPNDGYTSGHCTCANCLAWDHPDGEKMTWSFPGGMKFEGVSQSDRDVRFANTLGRLLKEKFPNRELFVMLNAYGFARNPPIGIVPDDNVIISSVANFSMRSPEHRKLPMEQHAGWAKKAAHLIWRPNLGSQAGLSWGMPDVAMTQAGEDFRFAAQYHCIGLYFDLFWFHWATQGPHYYALAHLAWNPQTDVEALMDDYYQRGFGLAASDVKAYWKLLEQTRMEFVAEEPSRQRAYDLPKKYTPELFAKAQSHLDAAATKIAGADEKYRRRLHFIQCGLDYSKLVVDTRAWMQKLEASKGKDAEAKARVMANWDRVEEMKKTFPEFSINWSAIFRAPEPGKDSKRVMGLHPDAPLSGRVLKELREAGLE